MSIVQRGMYVFRCVGVPMRRALLLSTWLFMLPTLLLWAASLPYVSAKHIALSLLVLPLVLYSYWWSQRRERKSDKMTLGFFARHLALLFGVGFSALDVWVNARPLSLLAERSGFWLLPLFLVWLVGFWIGPKDEG